MSKILAEGSSFLTTPLQELHNEQKTLARLLPVTTAEEEKKSLELKRLEKSFSDSKAATSQALLNVQTARRENADKRTQLNQFLDAFKLSMVTQGAAREDWLESQDPRAQALLKEYSGENPLSVDVDTEQKNIARLANDIPNELKPALEVMQTASKKLAEFSAKDDLTSAAAQNERDLARELASKIFYQEFKSTLDPQLMAPAVPRGPHEAPPLLEQIEAAAKVINPSLINKLSAIAAADPLDPATGQKLYPYLKEDLDTLKSTVQPVPPAVQFKELMKWVHKTGTLSDLDPQSQHLARVAQLAQQVQAQSEPAAAPTSYQVLSRQLQELQGISQQQFEKLCNGHVKELESKAERQLQVFQNAAQAQMTGQLSEQATLIKRVKEYRNELNRQIGEPEEIEADIDALKAKLNGPPPLQGAAKSDAEQEIKELEQEKINLRPVLYNPEKENIRRTKNQLNDALHQANLAEEKLQAANNHRQAMLNDIRRETQDLLKQPAAEHFAYMQDHLKKQKMGLMTRHVREQWGWDNAAYQYVAANKNELPGLADGREDYNLLGSKGEKGVTYSAGYNYKLRKQNNTVDKVEISYQEKDGKFIANVVGASNFNFFLGFQPNQYKENTRASLDFLIASGITQFNVVPAKLDTYKSRNWFDQRELFKRVAIKLDVLAEKQFRVFQTDKMPTDSELKKDFKDSYFFTRDGAQHQLYYVNNEGKIEPVDKDGKPCPLNLTSQQILDYLAVSGPEHHQGVKVSKKDQLARGTMRRRLNIQNTEQIDALQALISKDPKCPRSKTTGGIIRQSACNLNVAKAQSEIAQLAALGHITKKQEQALYKKLNAFMSAPAQKKRLEDAAEMKPALGSAPAPVVPPAKPTGTIVAQPPREAATFGSPIPPGDELVPQILSGANINSADPLLPEEDKSTSVAPPLDDGVAPTLVSDEDKDDDDAHIRVRFNKG